MRDCTLIAWDEASISNKTSVEILERTVLKFGNVLTQVNYSVDSIKKS